MIALPEQIKYCMDVLQARHFSVYAVGGCVRDSILGRLPDDWDLCTNAGPEEITDAFSGVRTIPTGAAHGTITVVADGMPVEITTFRTDGPYADHRRPERVGFARRIEDDLARRDFTINAMAYNPAQGLVDLYGGMEDLRRRVIRCVGDPARRFTEDALRILRMFRFSAQLSFSIDGASLSAAEGCAEFLDYISAQRIHAELDKILLSENPGEILQMMCDAGVLQRFLPEINPCIGFAQHNPYHSLTVEKHIFAAVQHAPAILPVRLALLVHDVAKPFCLRLDDGGVGHFKGHERMGAELAETALERLCYDRRTIRRVVTLVDMHGRCIPDHPKGIKRMLSKLGEEALAQLLAVRLADTSAKGSGAAAPRLEELARARAALEEALASSPPLRLEDLAVDGRDLIAIGYRPGRELGEALDRLLGLVLENETRNTKAYLLEQADRMLNAKA